MLLCQWLCNPVIDAAERIERKQRAAYGVLSMAGSTLGGSGEGSKVGEDKLKSILDMQDR
jgi:hypothetical protein